MIAVVITLLILFGWLRLILALEIASTGRQIQVLTEDKKQIERDNDYLSMRIAEALDPAVLASRAYDAGFRPSTPNYVPMPPPSAALPAEDTTEVSDSSELSEIEQTLLELAASQLDDLIESDTNR
jgi:hypothetical protein